MTTGTSSSGLSSLMTALKLRLVISRYLKQSLRAGDSFDGSRVWTGSCHVFLGQKSATQSSSGGISETYHCTIALSWLGCTAKYKMSPRRPMLKVGERNANCAKRGELEVCLRTEQLMMDKIKEEEADQ